MQGREAEGWVRTRLTQHTRMSLKSELWQKKTKLTFARAEGEGGGWLLDHVTINDMSQNLGLDHSLRGLRETGVSDLRQDN